MVGIFFRLQRIMYMKLIRLDKYISSQTSYSRSECRKLITTGRVRVEGINWVNADTKINAESSLVLIDGKPIGFKEFVYYLLNKPSDVLSATNDKSKKTVIDILGEETKHRQLFPVGRLDKDTTGLLLITDDGETAHKIISPKSKIVKSYIATLDGTPTDADVKTFYDGVVLADGTKCAPATLEIISENVVRVKICEGKYHQIKRMFGVVGLGVEKLHRESIGKMYIPENLEYGEYVEISYSDIEKLIFC